MKNHLYPALNSLGLAGVLIVNYLAVALPINGKTPGEISNLYPTLFTPAGLTFSIWSVIYVLLLIFAGNQLAGSLSGKTDRITPSAQIGPLFFINCLLNMGWLFAWHHLQIGLSFLVMLGILFTLVLIFLRMQKMTSPPWYVWLPFSIYLGWITVATIANASVLLLDAGWDRFGVPEATWAAIMIGAGTLIGLLMLFRHRNFAFVLVLIWAFFGIYTKRVNTEPVEEVVTMASLAAMFLLAAGSFYVGILRK